MKNVRRRWWIAASIAGLLVAGWAVFHPEPRLEASAVPPSVRAELAKTGFSAIQGIRHARFASTESIVGVAENWEFEQKLSRADDLITEKRSTRNAKAAIDESIGLYVGPFAVIRMNRARPPIVGNLLPYHLWNTTRISDFRIDEISGFPATKNAKMRGRITYEHRYPEGELAQIERCQLSCIVADEVDARSINTALTGKAFRIECQEDLEPDGRQLGPTNPGTSEVDHIRYAHWYIESRGWSIPIEGSMQVRLTDIRGTREWSSRLIAFE